MYLKYANELSTRESLCQDVFFSCLAQWIDQSCENSIDPCLRTSDKGSQSVKQEPSAGRKMSNNSDVILPTSRKCSALVIGVLWHHHQITLFILTKDLTKRSKILCIKSVLYLKSLHLSVQNVIQQQESFCTSVTELRIKVGWVRLGVGGRAAWYRWKNDSAKSLWRNQPWNRIGKCSEVEWILNSCNGNSPQSENESIPPFYLSS